MENLAFGLQVAVLGFMIVMVALAGLYLVMVIFSMVLNPNKRKEKNQKVQVSGEKQKAEGTTGKDKSDQPGELSPETVAVITAAVSSYLHRPSSGFRIVGVRPIDKSNNSSWKLSTRIN